MRVAGLDSTGDWRFGHGRALYLSGTAAIKQNLVTRIKSFAGDWFLDTNANIDWYSLLGRRGNEADIVRELVRVGQSTYGVASVTQVTVDSIDANRHAQITMRYTDIYKVETEIEVTV